MNRFIPVFVVIAIIFHSCKIGHKYVQPELHLPQTFDSTMQKGDITRIGWGDLYKDTVLQALIGKALAGNKDMLIAASRIREMIYARRIARADLLPGIGAEAYDQKEVLDYAKASAEVRAVLTFGWELDLWGNLRWQNEAAVAAWLQTVEAQRALQLALVAQVAQTYFELKALDRELAIVRQTLELRRKGAQMAKLRYEGGLTSEIPYRQSLVEQARTETLVPNLENRINAKENDLSVLLGEYPSGNIPRGEDIGSWQLPATLPADLPSALLKRRPDILAAEQQLIQANARVGAAYTDMFPTIRLTGRYGLENTDLTDFLKSPAWFITGTLTGPVFQMGKNKARHKASQEAYQQAVYSYRKTVLNVFKEVNNAISAFSKMHEVRQSHGALHQSAKTYHELAQLQYVNGVIGYIDLLDSQRQLFDAEIALNMAILNEMLSMVNLYKALGGGMEQFVRK
ncbi:MAG: efflux transporter outer membrane subunit [Bacteroidales bacterium]|jgi:multidrug efflux system outer membrane protein|nr:efflux transporter outer membrane subunit [Bacteroidales bacterium]